MGRADRATASRTGLSALALALLLSACSGALGEPAAPPDQTAVGAPAELPVPVASGPRVGATGTVNVLTGEPVPDARALGVTIDNTTAALPQAGLNQADLVYVAGLEDGSTGLLAVFQTEVPRRIGPVRPARSIDVGILGDHGAVALASAGADRGVLTAPAGTALQPVSSSAGPEGFTRDQSRPSPFDVVADGPALLARVPGSAQARDVGLRFGPVGDGVAAAAGEYAWSASQVEFAWSAEADAWVLQRGGEPALDEDGAPVRADNVLFMDVPVPAADAADDSLDRGAEGRPVGSGEVTLLRDGVAVTGAWSREPGPEPTRFTDATGEDLLLDVGTTWVVLMTQGDRPTLTPG